MVHSSGVREKCVRDCAEIKRATPEYFTCSRARTKFVWAVNGSPALPYAKSTVRPLKAHPPAWFAVQGIVRSSGWRQHPPMEANDPLSTNPAATIRADVIPLTGDSDTQPILDLVGNASVVL